MNIKTKLLFGIGILAGMIILLVTLSVVNLQLLTATEPDSPAYYGFLLQEVFVYSQVWFCFFGYRAPLVSLFWSLNKVFLK